MPRLITKVALITILGACTHNAAYSDELSWRPIMVTSEPLGVPNQIDIPTKLVSSCTSSKDINKHKVILPEIKKFATLSFNDAAISVAWSPDGKYLATAEGLELSLVKLWSIPDLKLLHVINRNSGFEPGNLKFTKDSKYLLTTSIPGYLTGHNGANAFSLIDVATGKVVREIPGYDNPPRYPLANSSERFDFSPNGKFFFVTFNGDLIHTYIYDTVSWKIVARLPIGWSGMASGPNGNQITLARSNELSSLIKRETDISIFNRFSQKPSAYLSVFSQNDFDERSVAVDSQHCIIGLGASGIHVRVINPAPNEFPWSEVTNPNDAIKIVYPMSNNVINVPASPPIDEMFFSQKNDLLAYKDGVGQIGLIYFSGTPPVPKQRLFIDPFNSELMDLSFDPSGPFLAIAGDDSVVIYKFTQ